MDRKRQRKFRFAVDMFIDVLGQVTGRKRVNYKCNAADQACWDVFMDTFGDGVGEDFIRKFLQYGFQSWFNPSSPRDYSRDIRFNWIFGKSAINRWNKLGMQTNLKIVQKSFKKTHTINTIARESELGNVVTSIRPVEEKFKAEFHNKKRGLLWCIANTTLYFHKSPWCATCAYKKDCKEILKKEFPKVYKKRGYGKESLEE